MFEIQIQSREKCTDPENRDEKWNREGILVGERGVRRYEKAETGDTQKDF